MTDSPRGPMPGDDLTDLLTDLVAIDSQNPSLVPGAAGEAEIVDYIVRWSKAAGLGVDVLHDTPGRPTVLVHSRGRPAGSTLMLCGHTDTVGFGGMDRPLAPRVEGDRMYGRGAYDMKAGLAAAMIACREAHHLGLSGDVVVAAVADEEHSSIGVSEALQQLRADAAIVTEPTELTVASAHRGFVWIEIEILGLAAHGSRPQLGIDAILKAGPVLVALADLNEQLRGNEHPKLGRGFVHGGLISGGREESTIPDLCTLTVERRTLPGETIADIEQEIVELLARCRTADPELNTRARTTLQRPPFETDDDQPVVQLVARHASQRLGRPAEVAGVSYWADSALIAEKGVPTVLFGPAGDGAHAAVEWVSLASTRQCTDTLISTAAEFCR